MSSKKIAKYSTDLAMTVLLLGQMAYIRIGETAHEWMGVSLFALFLMHHRFNGRWYIHLAKGSYTPVRVLQTAVNFLMLASMIGLMVSGIILSRKVFAFLPVDSGMSFARILHMVSAYWGFLFMSIHLGLHWGMIIGTARNIRKKKQGPPVLSWIMRMTAFLICGFGMYALFKHRIPDYLWMRSQFVFFDMEQPLVLFFAEYLAMMGTWICVAYYTASFLSKIGQRKNDTIAN